MAKETWVILGAQSAIASAFAKSVAQKGADIILAGRDQSELTRTASDIAIRYNVQAHIILFDVMNTVDYKNFIEKCQTLATGLLSLFIAIGNMPTQLQLEQETDLIAPTIHANYVGLAMLLNQWLPQFETQNGGHIVVIGSVAGERGRFSNYLYGSAKAGLHTYLQGLRARLFRANVSVTTIKPGFIDTAMTYGIPGVKFAANPVDCAQVCLKAARNNKDIVYFPWIWRWIMLIIRTIPERIFKRLKI